jgi:hypothetical protein
LHAKSDDAQEQQLITGRWLKQLGGNCIPALHLVDGGRPPTPTFLYRICDLIRHRLF